MSRVERGAQRGQVQVAVDAAELAAGFDHSGGAPAQCHVAVLPVLHVHRVVAGDGDHRLDAVGAAQRAGQGRRHAQAQHGQRLGQALAQRRCSAGMGPLQLLGQRFELCLGEDRGLGTVGRPHPLGDRGGEVIGQLVGHVPQLVQLAASDHRMIEDSDHRGSQRLAAVDADEDRPGRVQAALTQPGQQVGDHAGVLRRAFGQPERMLDAVDADPQRHQVQLGQVRGQQVGQCGLGRSDEPAADRGLARRTARLLDPMPDRFQADRVAAGGQAGEG